MATPLKNASTKGAGQAGRETGTKSATRRRPKTGPAEAAPAGEPAGKKDAKPTPSKPDTKKAAGRPGRKAADIELAVQIAGFLEELKYCLDAAIMRYSERVGGELERVRKELVGDALPPAKVLRRISVCLEEIRLKPHKGRVKDLARLEDLAEDLNDLLPPPESS